MKFVGGPRHGDEVPAWAVGRSELYVDGNAVRSPVDGSWKHERIRYVRQTWQYPDGREVAYLAVQDDTPAEEIQDSARMLLQEDS